MTMIVRTLLIAASLWCCTVHAAERVTAFTHVNVVPMDREQIHRDWTVLVAGDRIHALGPASRIRIPNGARLIDGSGKYLMPGLADMHAHSWDESDFTLLIANGVTTIRNMFGGDAISSGATASEPARSWPP